MCEITGLEYKKKVDPLQKIETKMKIVI